LFSFSLLTFSVIILEFGYGDTILVSLLLNGTNSLSKTTALTSLVSFILYLERSSTKASNLTGVSRSIYKYLINFIIIFIEIQVKLLFLNIYKEFLKNIIILKFTNNF